MSQKNNKFIKLIILLIFFIVPTYTHAQVATTQEARLVAENWIKFIAERDGHWANDENPIIKSFSELRKNDLLLGYYASIEPQGFIIVSCWKDFAPIKAYSTTGTFDPDTEKGIPGLLKGVLHKRAASLKKRFGGLDDSHLANLNKITPDPNRKMWADLLQEGTAFSSDLLYSNASIYGSEGPLLGGLRWNQNAPFNDKCPDRGCTNQVTNTNVKVGCVGLAMAQVMRYFNWPPKKLDHTYDWDKMSRNEANWNSTLGGFEDEHGNPWAQDEIDEVAKLCADAAFAVESNYGCDETGAQTCSAWKTDVRNAMRDFHYGDASDETPYCVDRNLHSQAEWLLYIVEEISSNRPMVYRVGNGDVGFKHAIVVDGYDDTTTLPQIHANYGWGVSSSTMWYVLDSMDCEGIGNCDLDEEKMVRYIYPSTSVFNNFSGTLSPSEFPSYIYKDVSVQSTVVSGGALIQFLSGASLTCGSGSDISIYGSSPDETQFYCEGNTRLKVHANGKIVMNPEARIRVHGEGL